jgi:ABC-2 type transport system ATP-binding protein/lipopolysaccharide transport system ATP-binding protein
MRSVEVDSVSKRFVLGRSSYATLRDDVMWALRPRRPAVSRELDLWALRDVSFEVDDGEVVGIIGHNGAGKSTLLRILARITEPTSGASRTRGRVGALLDVGTGFHPELSGRENVFLSGAILGLRRSEIRRRFDDIVSFAGIEKFLDTPIKRYSSGMYLRLAFSVAAHLEPDVVVVDEILAVGDAEFQRRSLGRMSEFANEGRTVLFVSHDLGAVSRICGRVIWMDQGTIRHDGPVARGIEAYLGAHGGQASYVELPFDEHDPVQLRAVAITNGVGEPLDAPRRDHPFSVRARLLVREATRGLDVRVYLAAIQGVRVLDESLLDAERDRRFGETPGEWEVSLSVPPVLAAGDYVLGVSVRSPYQRYLDREVLSFRLLPSPDESQGAIDRARLVQPPDVQWSIEPIPRD